MLKMHPKPMIRHTKHPEWIKSFSVVLRDAPVAAKSPDAVVTINFQHDSQRNQMLVMSMDEAKFMRDCLTACLVGAGLEEPKGN